MTRSIFTALVLLSLLAGALPAAAQETQPPPHRPLIFIRSYKTEPAIVQANGTFELFLELHNIGSAGAREILVTITSDRFVPLSTSSVKVLGSLQVNEHGGVSQTLRAVPDVEEGTYAVTVRLDYRDAEGFSYSSTETVGIAVSAKPKPGRPQLVILSVNTEPENLAPGVPFTMTVVVRNVGTGQARRVLLTSGGGDVPFAPVGASNVKALPDLSVGSVHTTTLSLVTSRSAKPGLYTFGLKLDYDDTASTPNHTTSDQSVALSVAARDIPQPQPVVASYATEPAILTPGSPFTITLTVQNAGEADARRLTASLGGSGTSGSGGSGGQTTTGAGTFAPLGSGNLKVLGTLAPGATQVVVQAFVVDGAANGGAYTFPIIFEFEDSDGAAKTDTQLISLLVRTIPQLQIGLYQPMAPIFTGQPFQIPLEVLNIGRNRANITTVEITSTDLELQQNSRFFGPLDAGTSDVLDALGIPRQPGRAVATVVVHYIDDFNKPAQLTHELVFEVQEGGPIGPGGPGGPGEPGGPGKPGGPGAEPPKPTRPLWLRALRGFLGLGSD
jgi:hypothetical protein